MALSSVSYVGDGSNKIFSVTFPYLAKSHVKVYVDTVETTLFTWLTGTSISITTAPGLSAVVLIKRTTPTVPLVDFVDGSTLTESLLDTSSLQSLYVVEESKDTADTSLLLDAIDGKYNANSKVIKNLAAPVNGNDAVNKTYADSTIPSSIAAAAASAAASQASAVASAASATASSNSATASSNSATAAANSATASANSATTAAGYVVPSQVGNAGKWLKTDGVNVSWVQAASVGSNSDITSLSALASINGGQIAGFRNTIINGAMAVDQRNAGVAQTITAAAALAYTADRWYAYCTGANVTGQRVAGSAQAQYRYRFTGAASVTKIGFAQRIETVNSYQLNNGTATLSVDLANSVLTTVTWTAWYANTADTFGTLASPTRTQIATGTFTVNSTVTRYNTNITIPSTATTGIEIEFSVGAQTSGTWTIGNVQLEAGSIATPFENRTYGTELSLCQRYYHQSAEAFADAYAAAATASVTPYYFPVEMRTTPSTTQVGTLTISNNTVATTFTFGANGLDNKKAQLSVTATATGRAYLYRPIQLSAEL